MRVNAFCLACLMLSSASAVLAQTIHQNAIVGVVNATDNLGAAVAVQANGAAIAVGAPAANTNDGLAYSYTVSSSGTLYPTLSAQITYSPPVAGNEGQFGTAVAFAGNFVLIGEPFNGNGFVYLYSSGILAYNVSGNNIGSDQFGFAITTFTTTAAGTYALISGNNANYVLSYKVDNTQGLINPVSITASGSVPGDLFGSSIFYDSGYILIGATGALNNNGTATGAAYLFYTSNYVNFTQITTSPLLPSDGVASDQFGFSVSAVAEQGIFYVGNFNTLTTANGAAYVFTCSGGPPFTSCSQTKEIQGSNNNQFGYSFAVSGNYLFIGAQAQAYGNYTPGGIYVYSISTPSSPTFLDNIYPNVDLATSNVFGNALALASQTLISGGPGSNAGDGEAWVFGIYPTPTPTPTGTGTLSPPVRSTHTPTATPIGGASKAVVHTLPVLIASFVLYLVL